jgi:hypothetical protein
MPKTNKVEAQLNNYLHNIEKDLGISVQVTSSDFNLSDDQAFINFTITASESKTQAVNDVLYKYDLLLDNADGENEVHFGADTNPFNSVINSGTLSFVYTPPDPGSAADGYESSPGIITDDFTLLYYKGNYSLFDL